MIVRPWKPGDTQKLELQPSQQYLVEMGLLDVDLTELSEHALAWVIEEDGEIFVIAGLAPQWENRALIWSYVSKNAGRHFRKIHKIANRFLDQADYRRIEATVDVGFEAGVRWIEMLGFKYEGYMKAYRPDGADMLLYARVR